MTYKQRLFLVVPEAGKMEERADCMSGESQLLGCQLLTASSLGGRGGELSGASWIRALIPFPRALLS